MNVTDLHTPEARKKLAEHRQRNAEIEANPTFDDVKKLWPSNMRGNIPIAQHKWDQITGAGMRTRVMDKDSGKYEEMFFRAPPQEIYRGAKAYVKVHTEDYKLSQYAKRFQNFLNGGYWVGLDDD